MGIAGSPDIFQGKMLELMESLEFVRAYLDDLLWISKLSLEDHLEKLEEVAISLLLNLEAARRGRRFAVFRRTKVTVQRKEKGVCIEHQIGFYELLTKPRLKAN